MQACRAAVAVLGSGLRSTVHVGVLDGLIGGRRRATVPVENCKWS
jgi:hypothetical protein